MISWTVGDDVATLNDLDTCPALEWEDVEEHTPYDALHQYFLYGNDGIVNFQEQHWFFLLAASSYTFEGYVVQVCLAFNVPDQERQAIIMKWFNLGAGTF